MSAMKILTIGGVCAVPKDSVDLPITLKDSAEAQAKHDVRITVLKNRTGTCHLNMAVPMVPAGGAND